MFKLLFVVALALSTLACEGMDDPTLAGDASADSLPPVRLDGGVKSDVPCVATSNGVVVTPRGKVPYVVRDNPVDCSDPRLANLGMTCSEAVKGSPSTFNKTIPCCITLSKDPLPLSCDGLGVRTEYTALCTSKGDFVGWLCATE